MELFTDLSHYKMKWYGYLKRSSPFFDTQEYIDLKKMIIKEIPEETITFDLPIQNKNQFRRNARRIMMNHLSDVNTIVSTINLIEFKKELYKRFPEIKTGNTGVSSLEGILKLILAMRRLEDVQNIPVIIKDQHSMIGKIIKPELLIPNSNFMERQPVTFCSIELGNVHNDILGATYVHEMYHALLERNKGSVENYLNAEILSIFMEKVAIFEIDPSGIALQQSERARLIDMKKYILNPNGSVEDQKEIISTLLAMQLFDLYIKSDENVRNEINSSINEVLNGKSTLESKLSSFDIGFDSGRSIETVKKRIII